MAHLDQARKGKFEFSVTIADEAGTQAQSLDDCKKALVKEISSSSSRLRRQINKKAAKSAAKGQQKSQGGVGVPPS